MDGVDVNMRISSGLQDERSSGFWLAKTTASADVSAAVAQGRRPCIYRLLGGATGPVGAQKVGADAKRLVLNEKSKRRKRKRKKQKKKLVYICHFPFRIHERAIGSAGRRLCGCSVQESIENANAC